MLNLNGKVDIEVMREVSTYVSLRFRNSSIFKTPEALALYEQKLLDTEIIKNLCEEVYDFELKEPDVSFVPVDLIEKFRGTNLIPCTYIPSDSRLVVVGLPELDNAYNEISGVNIDVVYTTIYYYFILAFRVYGSSHYLQEVPPKQLFDSIIREGIIQDAADLTLSSTGNRCDIYYNIRKKRVNSNRILSADLIRQVIKILCLRSPYDDASYKPKYVGVPLNEQYRGRVVINRKYKGFEITIRFLPNATFDKTPEQCNISSKVISFLREDFMDQEPGLRLLVGATMSGKNTTALSLLRELVLMGTKKVVSIEMPVEQELLGVEQINCEELDDYEANINSLIRQNPDFVYITEIGDTTGVPVMRMTNTGKCVLSTLHSNSVSDTIGRLMDVTGYDIDRVVQTLHSIVYQELRRDDSTDTVKPYNRFVRFTRDRKLELYGLSFGEVIKKITEWEDGD